MLAELLSRTPTMTDLSIQQARVVGALRHWVIARKLGHCPVAAMLGRLGSRRAAAHLHLLIEEIGAAWPDAFAVSPPCCPRLSHDEAVLAQMAALAACDDRPGFDRLLCDLIPGDARERLFLSSAVLSRTLDS
jgi:hypothetical protein